MISYNTKSGHSVAATKGHATLIVEGHAFQMVALAGNLHSVHDLAATMVRAEVDGVKANVRVGQVAYVYAMGEHRRGVITKVGRLNITVAYATRANALETLDPRTPEGYVVSVREKADRFANIILEVPATTETAPVAEVTEVDGEVTEVVSAAQTVTEPAGVSVDLVDLGVTDEGAEVPAGAFTDAWPSGEPSVPDAPEAFPADYPTTGDGVTDPETGPIQPEARQNRPGVVLVTPGGTAVELSSEAAEAAGRSARLVAEPRTPIDSYVIPDHVHAMDRRLVAGDRYRELTSVTSARVLDQGQHASVTASVTSVRLPYSSVLDLVTEETFRLPGGTVWRIGSIDLQAGTRCLFVGKGQGGYGVPALPDGAPVDLVEGDLVEVDARTYQVVASGMSTSWWRLEIPGHDW